jgi:hypothetical protein
MTPQERDLITGLFQRLQSLPAGEIDAEARELIERLGREQPLALYLLSQTAIVQEHALKGAQSHIGELESKLAQLSAGAPAAQPQHRSFLSGLLGGALGGAAASGQAGGPAGGSGGGQGSGPWGGQPAAARPGYAPSGYAQPAAAPAAAPGPWASPAASGGPSFLHSALSTAAGVAGGALLFQGIERMLGYGGSPFAQAGLVGGSGFGQPTEEFVVNNYGTGSDQGLAGQGLENQDDRTQADGNIGGNPSFVDDRDDQGQGQGQGQDPGQDPGQDFSDVDPNDPDPGIDVGGGFGEGGGFDNT